MASSGTKLGDESPSSSAMSISVPPGENHSKLWSRRANVWLTTINPKGMPGHILLPEPNGINSKSRPFTSTSLTPFRKRSGMNSVGRSHTAGSRSIAHTFTSSWVSPGMWYPPTVQASVDSWGSRRGAGGWSLRVSFTIACKYFSLRRSVSSNNRSRPTCVSSSCWAFSKISGWFIRDDSAHSIVREDVPAPALINVCNTKRQIL